MNIMKHVVCILGILFALFILCMIFGNVTIGINFFPTESLEGAVIAASNLFTAMTVSVCTYLIIVTRKK